MPEDVQDRVDDASRPAFKDFVDALETAYDEVGFKGAADRFDRRLGCLSQVLGTSAHGAFFISNFVGTAVY
ncbi:MAG: hypothetical protein EOS23_31155 [Mesorhizobium sp.]|uniref:hypothetical protein n=1 Tax=Mesorhizobium sp. TaxID=1871066 RepID=UPI000FE47184|nr:hypothetical protein [Mesorhizobium sp.]RWE06412.1 MAG: hypothetical protein EOS23_31155 [Mesorhizobium sp.]RWP15720.1 MAG: hypothetical protein EOR01_28815 [Mesorhizobium sp.]TIP29017.1 MAG: hypothetical protein E5X67_08585 [Mesorhizobium sp.]